MLFRSARIFKNAFLNGIIEKDPNKNNKEWSLIKDFDYELTEDPNINYKDKAIVKRAYTDLSVSASKLSKLQLVHTGVLPLEKMTSINQYFFGKEGQNFLSSKKILFDFSTIRKDIILSDSDVIKFDGHPNKLGHMKIADNIISSKSINSLQNFILKTCK